MLCLTCTLGNSSARKAVTYWEALSVSLVLICSNYDLRRKSLCPPLHPQLWLHFSAGDQNLNKLEFILPDYISTQTAAFYQLHVVLEKKVFKKVFL